MAACDVAEVSAVIPKRLAVLEKKEVVSNLVFIVFELFFYCIVLSYLI